MLQVKPLLTNELTYADLCRNTKLLNSNLINLSLEDSKIILKLLRTQLSGIQEQLNLNKETSRGSDTWVCSAKAARARKNESIAIVAAHIESIKPKKEVLPQIQRDNVVLENISLKKKLAKQRTHVDNMEMRKKILRKLLTERVSEDFMLELDKDTDAMLKAEIAIGVSVFVISSIVTPAQ